MRHFIQPTFSSRISRSILPRIGIFLVVLLCSAGCGAMRMPSLGDIFPAFAPATPTPTATPIPTATPQPTATLLPGEAPSAANQQPTPQVIIPTGFQVIEDAARGYSLALPSGWSELDLRGAQVTRLANLVGQGQALAQLQQFLDTEEGQAIGAVAITDLGAAMFGGLPTVLNVSVVDAPNMSAEEVVALLKQQAERNAGVLGSATIESMDATTINNMPAVQGIVIANLSNVGMDAQIFGKVTGLVANNKVYILTLITQESSRGAKEIEFDQIIGTFRPQ